MVSLTNRTRSSRSKHRPLGWSKSSARRDQSGAVRFDPIDAPEVQFRIARHTVIFHAAEGRVAEIDVAVGFDDDVVRAVQRLVPVVGGEDGNRPVGLGAG